MRAVLTGLALLAAGCGGAPEVTDPTTLAPAPAAASIAAAAVAVNTVGDAVRLAMEGRLEGDPEKLVEAAERLANTPSRERDFPGRAADAEAPASVSPADLLTEAEAIGDLDDALEVRVEALRSRLADPTLAGAERGPQRYSASVARGAVRRHELYFEGPAPAVIQVRGSGATNLDVSLYDVEGDRVAADDGPSDVATVHWYVPYTQTLTLVIRNRGARSNAYYVITN